MSRLGEPGISKTNGSLGCNESFISSLLYLVNNIFIKGQNQYFTRNIDSRGFANVQFCFELNLFLPYFNNCECNPANLFWRYVSVIQIFRFFSKHFTNKQHDHNPAVISYLVQGDIQFVMKCETKFVFYFAYFSLVLTIP